MELRMPSLIHKKVQQEIVPCCDSAVSQPLAIPFYTLHYLFCAVAARVFVVT